MNDRIIDVDVVGEKIVRCPKCGQRNRVYRQKKGLAYRCGRCRTKIAGRFAVWRWLKPLLIYGGATAALAALAGSVVLGIKWIRNRPTLAPPPAISVPANLAPRVVANGAILEGVDRVGSGTLTINNQTASDAVVKLVNETNSDPSSIISFYVGRRQTATLRQIPEARFRVFFSTGADWDPLLESFTTDDLYAEFDRAVQFSPADSQHELTLGDGVGKTSSSPITKADFMR